MSLPVGCCFILASHHPIHHPPCAYFSIIHHPLSNSIVHNVLCNEITMFLIYCVDAIVVWQLLVCLCCTEGSIIVPCHFVRETVCNSSAQSCLGCLGIVCCFAFYWHILTRYKLPPYLRTSVVALDGCHYLSSTHYTIAVPKLLSLIQWRQLCCVRGSFSLVCCLIMSKTQVLIAVIH